MNASFSSCVSSPKATVLVISVVPSRYCPPVIKNKTEVDNERMVHIRDGVAVTKLIYWLKKNIGTGIHQHKPARFQFHIALLRRRIVDDCSMLRISHNRLETRSHIMFLLPAELLKFVRHGKSLYVDEKKTNYAVMMNRGEGVKLLTGDNFTLLPKCIKNKTERTWSLSVCSLIKSMAESMVITRYESTTGLHATSPPRIFKSQAISSSEDNTK